jgi:tetratricopeptide (TPR) repeat protein
LFSIPSGNLLLLLPLPLPLLYFAKLSFLRELCVKAVAVALASEISPGITKRNTHRRNHHVIETLKSLLSRDPRPANQPTEAELREREAAAQAERDHAAQRAQTLVATAQTRRDANDRIGAAIYYSEAITLLRNANASVPLAHALLHAAEVRSEMREYGVAGTLIEEAIRLYRAFEPPAPLDLATAYRISALNEERQALTAWTEALNLYTAAGDTACATECEQHIIHLKHNKRDTSAEEQSS